MTKITQTSAQDVIVASEIKNSQAGYTAREQKAYQIIHKMWERNGGVSDENKFRKAFDEFVQAVKEIKAY